MIADLKPYGAMKDSGFPWLDAIPVNWEIRRAKYVLQETDTRWAEQSGQLLSVSQYTGITKRRLREGSDEPATRSATLEGYKVVAANDLAINIMLAWNGSLGVSPFDGVVSPAYCVYRFVRPREALLGVAREFLTADQRRDLMAWWLARPTRKTPNWDIVSNATIDGRKGLLLVEAKAHLSELKTDDACGAAEPNCGHIHNVVATVNDSLNLSSVMGWGLDAKTHYQLGNRFAWSWKLASMGIPVEALYAGGHFTQAGFNVCNNIAKWDGAAWLPLGTGVNGPFPEVFALASFTENDDEHLYAGGHFTSAGFVGANNIARWDGVTWTTVGGGMNGSVEVLKAIELEGRHVLLAGGQFTTAGAKPASRVAIWGPVGIAPPIVSHPGDDTVTEGDSIVLSVSVTGSATYQWRKDGTPLVDTRHITGSSSAMLTIANASLSDDGIYDVIVSNPCGDITSNSAVIDVRPPCTSDITLDGTVNVSDLLVVIQLWGPCFNFICAYADIAPPGGNNAVNVEDLLAVISSWGDCS